MKYHSIILFFILLGSLLPAYSGGIRDHTRPTSEIGDRNEIVVENIEISQAQANELTLTVVKVEKQFVQTWIRLAADIDKTRKVLTSSICGDVNRKLYGDSLIRENQRVVVFPPSSKSSIYRATVSKLYYQHDCLVIKAQLTRTILLSDRFYIMEILVPRGRLMAVPKEAIIEESHRQVVYVKTHQGSYIPKIIHTGLQGDLYTEIKHGLIEGEQVVTLGSFFIDAQYKLNRSSGQDYSDESDLAIKSSVKSREANHAHHHH